MSRVWSEFRFWSPLLGCDAARLSMNGDSQMARLRYGDAVAQAEYYAVIEAGEGRTYRDRRARVLEELERAIERGDPPGEVEVKNVNA